MKARIAKNWWVHYVREQPGKTQAEKEAHAEMIFSSFGKNWAHSMNKTKGKWVDIETEFLFEDQFNVAIPSIRLMAKHIDAIDFSPEFRGLSEYQEAVQERYNKDWPGRKVNCAILKHYIKEGFIEDLTSK